MSLDNISKITIASSTDMLQHLYEPHLVTTDRVDITATKSSMSDSNLILMREGAKGWDMPAVSHSTRQTAEGHGEISTSYKLRGRRFSFRASELVSYNNSSGIHTEPETQNSNMVKLKKHLDPFTRSIVCVDPIQTGAYNRYLIACKYLGGIDRGMRTGQGRSHFDVNLFSPWGYFVLNQVQGSTTFTPQGEGVCIWGVKADNSAGIREVNFNITNSGTSTSWSWRWSPSQVGITPPATALGSNPPTTLIVCFSPPFMGVWGSRSSTRAEVSAGRISGAPMPPYLTPGETSTMTLTGTAGTTGNPFYLRNYSSLSY